MDEKTKNIQEARQKARAKKRRKLMLIRTTLVLAVVLVLVLVGALIVMKIVGTQQSKRGETANFLAVRNIVIEGDTRYSDEQIIEASGLYVGQSLLGVNKVTAHDNLLEQLPYLNSVTISNTQLSTLRIRLTETTVMAAVQVKDGWMIVGDNNQALEHITEGEPPEGILRIGGATLLDQQVGSPLLDERSLRITRLLEASISQYELEGVTGVDMTEKTRISLTLNGRLQVLLGNDTAIPAQITMLVDTLPVFYQNNGVNAGGRLDMRTFADDKPDNNKVIYTPPEELKEEKPATKKTEKKTDKTKPTE